MKDRGTRIVYVQFSLFLNTGIAFIEVENFIFASIGVSAGGDGVISTLYNCEPRCLRGLLAQLSSSFSLDMVVVGFRNGGGRGGW